MKFSRQRFTNKYLSYRDRTEQSNDKSQISIVGYWEKMSSWQSGFSSLFEIKIEHDSYMTEDTNISLYPR